MIDLEPALKKGEKEIKKLYKKSEGLINKKVSELSEFQVLNLYAGGTEKITIKFGGRYPVIVIKELVKRLNADYKFTFRQMTDGFVVYLNKNDIPEEQQQ